VPTRKEVASLSGHQFRVWMAQFSADGKTLVTSAEDRTVRLWDLAARPRLAARDATEKELAAWWADLAAGDAARAGAGSEGLASAPSAGPFVKRHLPPAPAPEAKFRERMSRLLADLDSGNFAVRERASEELAKMGRAAEPSLRFALEARPPVEVRR